MGKKPEYGIGHPTFVEYTHFIENNDAYRGMPDVYTDKGHIQWEAPSNRISGKHKDTYQKRLQWWRNKASEVGINPNSAKWISRTAKMIHSTKKKPCKRCGRVMDLRYAYPTKILRTRIEKLGYADESFPLDPLEHITDLVTRLVERYGETIFGDFPKILSTGKISTPPLNSTLQRWLEWIETAYIPSEPATLSPGAMSNAPDRFDGFHSFNLCCRSEADTGRHIDNLRSYVTDRRVFEYWNEGDWIAANQLMGEIRSKLRDEVCLYGHPGPCSADHVGPLSLGFAHRPEFQILCHGCNSAKNNRMTLSDVVHLKKAEKSGEIVTSWYNKNLWDYCKDNVVDDETARRLSKLLRDNRHTAMSFLGRVIQKSHFTFLTTYLCLSAADFDAQFVNLRVEKHMTHFDKIIHIKRETKYAAEQKARRIRIAFESLLDYFRKENRNDIVLSTDMIGAEMERVLLALQDSPQSIKQLDAEINTLLSTLVGESADLAFRDFISRIPTSEPRNFDTARKSLAQTMDLVATEFSKRWNDERYVRSGLDIEM